MESKLNIADPNFNAIFDLYSSQFCVIDKITDNDKLSKYNLNYKYSLIAICRNGGLIAMSKAPHYMDYSNKSPILSYIIVMHQDGSNVYKIKNSDLYNKNRQLVGLEFNYKEQLYAFCDSGDIFKIDILKNEPQPLTFTSIALSSEKILKVKAFDKGFIILTKQGTLFYLKDLKSKTDSPLEFIVSLRDNLKFENYENCNFVIIPSSVSEDSEDELLVCSPNKDGIFLIKKNKQLGTFTFESKSQNYSDRNINAFYLSSNSVETFNTQVGNKTLKPSIGKVSGIAINESKKKVAFYVAEKKTVYILSSKIPSKGALNFRKYEFKIEHNDFDDESDKKEKDKILDFKNKQLLFLNEDCVAICGGRWIVIMDEKGKTFAEDLNIKKNKKDNIPDDPMIYCKGISEVDGIRLMTTDEILLIRKLPKDLAQLFDIFKSDYPVRQLLSSYEKYEAKDPFSNDELRGIKNNLSDSIFTLLRMAGFLYWRERDKEKEKKELQNYFLKAANYGKSIFGKGEFNFDKFNNICMDLRIINAFRNFGEKPRFLTLEEYENLDSDLSDTIIQKTMRQLNFKFAFKIAKFLGLPEKDIYLKYALKKIKKIGIKTTDEVNIIYNDLMLMLQKLENISYIDLAKKCFKYNKKELGDKFLDNEKSSLVKIPLYLESKEWKKAIELVKQGNDINAINIVLDSIYQVEAKSLGPKGKINNVFIDIVKDYDTLKIPIINYLKKNNKKEDLLKYLQIRNDNEELFYLYLEDFFNSNKKSEREDILNKIKSCKFEKSDKDKEFYTKYISDLESSLKFKKECLEKGIFSKDETTNFDNSIFDCFEKVILKDFEWIQKENNHFNFTKRKLTIMRIKELFKQNKIQEIDKLMQEGPTKLGIPYLKVASMFLERENKEKAIEYALKENDKELLEDKVNFLIKLDKLEEAAETAIKIKKNNDKVEEIFIRINKIVEKDENRAKAIQQIYYKRFS